MNQEYMKPELEIIRFDTEEIMNGFLDPSMGDTEVDPDWGWE